MVNNVAKGEIGDNVIDFKWVQQEFDNQKGLSVISGVKLTLYNGKFNTISIDRINNSINHIKSNCILITKAENYLRLDLQLDKFIEWLGYIINDKNRCDNFMRHYDLTGSKENCQKCNEFNINNIPERIIQTRYYHMKHIPRKNVKTIECNVNKKYVRQLIAKSKGVDQIWGLHTEFTRGDVNIISCNRIDSSGHWDHDNIQITIGRFSSMRNNNINNEECRYILECIRKNYDNLLDLLDIIKKEGKLLQATTHTDHKILERREYIDNILQIKEGKLVNPDIIIKSNEMRYKIQCKKGHVFETNHDNVKRSRWCNECSGHPYYARINVNDINEFLQNGKSTLICKKKYTKGEKYKKKTYCDVRCIECTIKYSIRTDTLKKQLKCKNCKK